MLKVQPVAAACRVAKQHFHFTPVPRLHHRRPIELPGLGEFLEDALLVMLVAVEHQQVLPGVDVHYFGQSVQLGLVNGYDIAFIVVHRTVGHLKQLSCDSGGGIALNGVGHLEQLLVVLGVQLLKAGLLLQQGDDLLLLQLVIGLSGLPIHGDRDGVVNDGRQLQPVLRAHAQAQVFQLPVDGLLGTHAQPPLIHDVAFVSAGGEVAHPVVADPLAQPLAAVQQEDLGPQVKVAVWCGSAGQAPHHLAQGRYLLQGLEPLAVGVLETGQLVQHQSVEGPLAFELLQQPDHIVPAQHIDVGRCLEGFDSLLLGARDHADPELLKLVPLGHFLLPDVLGHVLRGDDQHLVYVELIFHELPDDPQGRYGFT